jgi:hypothetical protein
MEKAKAQFFNIALLDIKLPFSILIVDDKEAAWRQNSPYDEVPPLPWSNDPTQIAILKMSFENLWQKSFNVFC